MRVRFWGTRGSVPTPGPTTVRYGGNTSCVEVRTNAQTVFIFDSGTGIRELGLHLTEQGGQVAAHLMLGHTHWDHISGFPFFAPGFVPGNRLTIYGSHDLARPLREVLEQQMHFTYFPIPLTSLRADIEFVELEEGAIQISDAIVRTHALNHSTVCMGYRVEADGASVAYITDHEPFDLRVGGEATNRRGLRGHFIPGADRRLIEFVRGVDLLIQDAQYTHEEYVEKLGWGHGSTDYVADVAVEAGVRRVALFHHEPTHSDDQLDRMVDYARARVREVGSDVEIFAAAEGQSIDL
jgi:phosphoribosyl 1,2-cyclic phosphodiesterase